jgi:MFS family permease
MTTILGPIVAQASDYWGRKVFLVVLSATGAIGAIVIARASSMGMIIAGFSIIGIAFSVQPLLHAVASEVLPRRLRSWAQASLFTGLYCATTRQVRWGTLAGFSLFAFFFATMASATRSSSVPVWGYSVFVGSGIGISLVLLITVAQLSTPPELIATASWLIISVRSLGGTIGIAICELLMSSHLNLGCDS